MSENNDTATTKLNEKYGRLLQILGEYDSVCVAFSSGVDSTFLLQAAHEVLGTKVLAITTMAPWFPLRESDETKRFCASRGIQHIVISMDDSEIPVFRENPPDRCYHCKKVLFKNMIRVAAEHGIGTIVEGSNTDDDIDYRPGHIAIRELGIRSPLREAGFSKDEIRQMSKQMGLPTWDKPTFACLASRFPYHETITEEKLRMVEQAEDFLLASGFTQMRVRIHESENGDLIGRIELPEEDIPRLMDSQLRGQIRERLKNLGFSYTCIDLTGYQTGSLNQGLDSAVLRRGKNIDDTDAAE